MCSSKYEILEIQFSIPVNRILFDHLLLLFQTKVLNFAGPTAYNASLHALKNWCIIIKYFELDVQRN